MPEDGERKLTEREVAAVVDGFSARKAFGKGKGLGRGDVFRYHDFIAAASGGAAQEGSTGKKVGQEVVS